VNPGPGTYVARNGINTANGRTFEKVDKGNPLVTKELLKTPGPGVYKQESKLSKQGCFIVPGRPDNDKADKVRNPGPGSYSH